MNPRPLHDHGRPGRRIDVFFGFVFISAVNSSRTPSENRRNRLPLYLTRLASWTSAICYWRDPVLSKPCLCNQPLCTYTPFKDRWYFYEKWIAYKRLAVLARCQNINLFKICKTKPPDTNVSYNQKRRGMQTSLLNSRVVMIHYWLLIKMRKTKLIQND